MQSSIRCVVGMEFGMEFVVDAQITILGVNISICFASNAYYFIYFEPHNGMVSSEMLEKH